MRKAHPRCATPVLALLLATAAPGAAQEREEEHPERAEEVHDPMPMTPDHAMHGDDDAVEEAVREVVQGFKDALRTGDSTAALALLHPEVRIYEGGHAETKEEYRAGHLGADMALLAAVSVETTRDAVANGHMMALYLSEYQATGRFRDREVDVRGTETIVLVPTADGWRIRHIHWSSR